MTGTEISNHNIAGEPLNILCIEDGAGFLKGHVYVITDDGVIVDVFAPHTHTSNSNGGSLYDIFRDNYKNIIELDMSANIFRDAFVMTERSTGTGGLTAGTLADEVDNSAHTKYVIATTAGTNGSGDANLDFVNMIAGGGMIYFGAPLTLQLKYAVSHNTSIAYRMGVGQPLIENTVGNSAQLGFEGCTSTNQMNRAFSADGTTWSGEELSNMVPLGAVPFGLRIDLYPSSKIVATDSDTTPLIKTTNLPPPSSATNADALFRAGIKQLSPSTQRWLKLYALRLVGSSYDSQPSIRGWC